MKNITRIGLDTSKSVFQLHGVDGGEQPVLCRKLRRRQVLDFFRKLPATRVGIEACGGAHYWARELAVLGHDVKLLPAQHVKPYVRRNKNDAADAEAICEAMSRVPAFAGITKLEAISRSFRRSGIPSNLARNNHWRQAWGV